MKCLFTLSFSLLLLAQTHANESVLFEDPLASELKPGWRWLREDPQDWRFQDQALEIRVRPGNAQTVRNALVREAPDRTQGPFAIEVTITSLTPPTEQFEQAGITWYSGGEPAFKFVKELVDGKRVVVPGFAPMTNRTVQLRVVISGNSWTGWFRPNAEGPFQKAATGEVPSRGQDEISLQCYHGPDTADHWIRFKDFRIVRVDD
jgi:hypothetical protein